MEQAKLISTLEEDVKYLIEHEKKVQQLHFGFWEKQLREDTEKLFDKDLKIKVQNLAHFRGKQIFLSDYPRTYLRSFYSTSKFYSLFLNVISLIVGNHRAKIRETFDSLKEVEDAGFIDILKQYPNPNIGAPRQIKHRGFTFTWRYLRHIYFLGIFRQQLRKQLESNAILLDIGSGYGIFSSLIKQDMPKSHNVLVDLPGQLILAHYYLSQLMPEAKIAGFKEVSQVEKIDKSFIEQFDFVLVPTSMYGKLTEHSVDVVSNFASFSEMSREWFDLYMQSGVFKTAPFVYLVNRYDAYPTYYNNITVLDYPLKEYEAIHMRNCPLFKNHYRGVKFFWYEAVRYPSEFFEFIGKRLDLK